MSVSMTKGKGVTVFTVASNPKSKWPLLCQILGTLCYSPVCSLSLGLRKLQGNSQSALGTIQIMTGLLNMGLGAILICTDSSWRLWYYWIPFWLGGVYLAGGFMCILAGRFPIPCLVGINVLMNMAGAGVAIAGIVLYSIDLIRGDGMDDWSCSPRRYYYWGTPLGNSTTTEMVPNAYMEQCNHLKWIAETFVKGIETVLIVLSVLQLSVNISSAVLSIKALCRDGEEKNKSQSPELYNPLLEA